MKIVPSFPKNVSFRLLLPAFVVMAFILSALFFTSQNSTVSAQQDRKIKNPTELVSKPDPRRGGDLNFDLDIRYAYNFIPNPSTGVSDKVYLRSYNGELAGPTMKVRPGQVLRINLKNNLNIQDGKNVPDPTCQSNQDQSIPHCYNSTNLHTHGWHVSPTGNSDNVLLDLSPGTNLDYEYYLPKDHPAGTFWYHSHRHGSTAIQVSSGMAGTLIVEGFRQLKDKAANGIADIDTILKDTSGQRFTDRVMMFQQMAYYCGTDQNGNIIWDCTGKVGMIESYNGFGPGGPNSWSQSGRFTTINGIVQPLIETQAGKIERWRLVHAGVRDTINFRLTRTTLPFTTPAEMNKALADVQKLSAPEQNAWLQKNCALGAGQGLTQSEFAVDGLTRKQMSNKFMNVLQPGYRSDVLVTFDLPGVYCVLDDATPPEGSINSIPVGPSVLLEAARAPKSVNLSDTRLLSMVFVTGGTPFKGDPAAHIASQLIAANPDLPAPVLNDLKTLRVPEYVPHPDIPKAEVTGKQELSFAIRVASDQATTLFQIAKKAQPTQLDYYSYDPNRIDRVLTLGGVDEWTLTSGSIGHPFHIHVNPFQIIQILKPDGTPVVDSNGKCTDGTDPQYCDQIGIFRDTLFVKNPTFDPTGLSKGYTIIMRTRYERYIGDFVIHCHILDHEDSGMMENIRVAPKGGYIEGSPVPTEGVIKHGH